MRLKDVSSWTESERRVYYLVHETVRFDLNNEFFRDEAYVFHRFATMGVGLSCWGFFGTVRSALTVNARNSDVYN
jgi:hypothetical protein